MESTLMCSNKGTFLCVGAILFGPEYQQNIIFSIFGGNKVTFFMYFIGNNLK